MSDFGGRTYLITGGAGHLGRRIAAELCHGGATVVIADTSEACISAEVRTLETEFEEGRVHFVSTDLSDAARAESLIPQALELSGRIDGLVHAASLVGSSALPGWSGALGEQSVEAWRTALEVNLTSAFVLLKSATPHFRQSGTGSAVLISSIYGFLAHDPSLYAGTTMSSPAAYGASKAALIQLARWFASEWGTRARCNAVSPGGIERSQPETFRRRYEDKTALGRMATEDDVTGVILFLLSDAARYVTGQNIVVDGGLSIR